jgi:hypothetical protein
MAVIWTSPHGLSIRKEPAQVGLFVWTRETGQPMQFRMFPTALSPPILLAYWPISFVLARYGLGPRTFVPLSA